MKKNDYVKACGNCAFSTYLAHNGECYCELKGPVSEDGKCRKYRFDLLKHRPNLPIINFNESELI